MDIDITCSGRIDFNKPGESPIRIGGKSIEYDHQVIYQEQLDYIAEHILLDAKPELQFDTVDPIRHEDTVKWMMDELVAGSAVSNLFNTSISADDVDVYFKSIEDAMLFAKMNKVEKQVRWNLAKQKDQLNICAWVTISSRKYNLIWGIKYKDAEDLISGFDIRACAMVYDPCWDKIHMVKGALYDAHYKQLIWQPTVKSMSVHRLLKYSNKGFTINPLQRVMFAELLKTKHNVDLELSTGYGENKI